MVGKCICHPCHPCAGLDHALHSVAQVQLQAAGLKCGGSLAERSARLFLLRDTPVAKLDRKHLAKPAKT